jgi:hypothetical protein
VKIDTSISSVSFIYPFLYDGAMFEQYANQVDVARWSGIDKCFQVWNTAWFPEDDLLPHVANYLNPSKGSLTAARAWELDDIVLQSPNAGLGSGSVSWFLEAMGKDIPFSFKAIQLVLFRVGVGLLTLRAAPEKRNDDVCTWLDFLHFFRYFRGRAGTTLRAERRVGFDQEKKEVIVEPYFPQPVKVIKDRDDGHGQLDDIIHALLHTIEDINKAWWDDVFIKTTLLPYAVLFVDETAEEERPLLRYRARKFFYSTQEMRPTPMELLGEHRRVLEYSDDQWFTFSLDGSSYIAFDAPHTPFFRQTLPNHLHREYYLLYLLTLHQRFTLSMLSEMVANRWLTRVEVGETDLVAMEASFSAIRDKLLLFTASGNFTQVTLRDNPHRCYRRWQETFQLDKLYQEVHDEIGYMHDAILHKRDEENKRMQEVQRCQSEKLEKRLNHITWLLGAIAVGLAMIEALNHIRFEYLIIIMVGIMVIGLLIIWVMDKLPEIRE